MTALAAALAALLAVPASAEISRALMELHAQPA